MEHFNELAGRIRQLFKTNQTEWKRLADEGLQKEMDNVGSVCFMLEREITIPEAVIRLSCIHDVKLVSTPILKYPTQPELRDFYTKEMSERFLRNQIRFIIRAGAKKLKPAGVEQIEAWLDKVERHFGKTGPGEDSSSIWKPSLGYIGAKTIEADHNVPRTTLQKWYETDKIHTVKDPKTQEVYVPEKWLTGRLEKYRPRKKRNTPKKTSRPNS